MEAGDIAGEYNKLLEINAELVEALKAWMVYYEGHSTQDNRDRAYGLTRQALRRAEAHSVW